MKVILILPFILLWSFAVSAQLTIGQGALLNLTGNAQLTLHNANLVNHGLLGAANSSVRITGHLPTSIEGSQAIQFFDLEINKTNNNPFDNPVILGRSVAVANRLRFTSGMLNMNGQNVDLGALGFLDGERDSSRIYGSGRVLATANLNAPTGANPGNLGIHITSTKNLGLVNIRRGHQPHAVTSGVTILRYYDIVPQNNIALNATLRFSYFNSELYGVNENFMVFIKSTDNGVLFSNEGFSARDTVLNYVEKTGINSFARFTLANGNYALPVHLTAFNVKCIGTNAAVTWKTAQEQNSSHFNIESSADGMLWAAVGTLQAAGNSSSEKSYSFIYNNPGQKSYYRIAQYDRDGTVRYTSILRSSCAMSDAFLVWPNPVKSNLHVSITSANASDAVIRIFDSKGSLVKYQSAGIVQGSNQLHMDVSAMAGGVYTLSVEWNNGQMRKAMQIVKQ